VNDSLDSSDESFENNGNIIKGFEKATTNLATKVTDFFGINNPSHFVFLLILGILSALVGYSVDYLSQYLITCMSFLNKICL
jgi:hypothetical protein